MVDGPAMMRVFLTAGVVMASATACGRVGFMNSSATASERDGSFLDASAPNDADVEEMPDTSFSDGSALVADGGPTPIPDSRVDGGGTDGGGAVADQGSGGRSCEPAPVVRRAPTELTASSMTCDFNVPPSFCRVDAVVRMEVVVCADELQVLLRDTYLTLDRSFNFDGASLHDEAMLRGNSLLQAAIQAMDAEMVSEGFSTNDISGYSASERDQTGELFDGTHAVYYPAGRAIYLVDTTHGYGT